MINFFVILQGGLAIYLIFMVAKGTSKLFTNAYVKDGKEAQYKKTMRVGLLVVAGMMIVLAVINYLAAGYPAGDPMLAVLSTWNVAFAVLVLTTLLVILFLLRRLQDKEKRQRLATGKAPRAAFYFDEEETAAPAPKKRQKK